MLTLFFAILLCVSIHLLTMAATGLSLGIKLRELVVGQGPVLFRHGRFQLRALPTGGHVSFLDTRSMEVAKDELAQAFDQHHTGEQILVMLSGCLVLLVIGGIIWPGAIITSLNDSFLQLITGAISPFNDAQTMIAASLQFAKLASFSTLLGIVAIKLAAFNLLPLPMLNGGAAIAAVASQFGVNRYWPEAATKLLIYISIGLYCSWMLAVATYVVQHLT